HSGDHAEFDLQIAAIRERVPATTPLYVVGVSVGGSVLINWLGRKRAEPARTIAAAAAVSTPLDLEASGIAIAKGANRIYTRNFLSTLKPKSLAMARRFPELLDDTRIRRARTLRDFDDAVTSLLHGFIDATDYWR